jgi:hypothetical protein
MRKPLDRGYTRTCSVKGRLKVLEEIKSSHIQTLIQICIGVDLISSNPLQSISNRTRPLNLEVLVVELQLGCPCP